MWKSLPTYLALQTVRPLLSKGHPMKPFISLRQWSDARTENAQIIDMLLWVSAVVWTCLGTGHALGYVHLSFFV